MGPRDINFQKLKETHFSLSTVLFKAVEYLEKYKDEPKFLASLDFTNKLINEIKPHVSNLKDGATKTKRLTELRQWLTSLKLTSHSIDIDQIDRIFMSSNREIDKKMYAPLLEIAKTYLYHLEGRLSQDSFADGPRMKKESPRNSSFKSKLKGKEIAILFHLLIENKILDHPSNVGSGLYSFLVCTLTGTDKTNIYKDLRDMSGEDSIWIKGCTQEHKENVKVVLNQLLSDLRKP